MILDIHDAIDSNPNKLSGEVCFAGTRVPVRTLFDCLGEGYTLEQFFDDFPSVGRDEVLTVLDYSRQCVQASARHRKAEQPHVPAHKSTSIMR